MTLRPLTEKDIEPLIKIAETDKLCELWFTSVPSRDDADAYFDNAFAEQKRGTALPFTVVLNKTNEIVGTTRFYRARAAHRQLCLGYTWYAKKCQRTAVNTECKLLLLEHAFTTLNCVAVVFETHHLNHRSQQAITRLGARQDGILRNDQILPDGTLRDTVRFSILEHEWPAIKVNLQNKLRQHAQDS